MIALLRAAVLALVVTLAGPWGASAARVPTVPAQVAYAYDAPAMPTASVISQVDRGPPGAAADSAFQSLVVRWSNGTLTRAGVTTTHSYTTYDVPASLVQVDNTTSTTKGTARLIARHGADFGATSAGDYARMSSEFFQRGGAQHLPTKIAPDGTIRMFDPATNTFGSFAPNGMTKTLFKPTSPDYWSRQPGVLQ